MSRLKKIADFKDVQSQIQNVISTLDSIIRSDASALAYTDSLLIAKLILKNYDPKEYLDDAGLKNKISAIIDSTANKDVENQNTEQVEPEE